MGYIEGDSRYQRVLFPDVMDDFIDLENPVRVIDAYVESLDLDILEFSVVPYITGRPPYNPKDLLKLYIYGYFNKIRSSRKLEVETHRNIEVMWLLKRLSPDHKTISRFRKENVLGLKKVFRNFVQLCNEMGLYGKELIAIDGSKFKAVNSLENNFGLKKLEDRITRIDKHLESYLIELDEHDKEEIETKKHSKEEIAAAIEELKNRKQCYETMQNHLESSGETQISTTDPDAKRMKHRNGLSEVCYNVQTAVDSKNKLIAEYEVTDRCNDKNLLTPMYEKTQEILNTSEMSVVADNGYFSATDIAKCIAAGGDPHVSIDCESVTFCMPVEENEANTPETFENQGKNVFVEERNIGICPMGIILYPRSYSKNRKVAVYANAKECSKCERKDICKRYHKTLEVSMPEGSFTKQYNDKNVNVKQIWYCPNKKIIMQRKSIAEHPFGTVKRHQNASYCLLKGKENVSGEFALTFLVYNLKRVINIMGTQRLIKELSY